jgi:hypothetical protein
VPIALPDPWPEASEGVRRDLTALSLVAGATTAAARVYRSTNQSITSGGSGAAISFDTEQFDWGGLWESGTRLTAPLAGVYLSWANVAFAANGTGERSIQIKLNGTTNVGTANRLPIGGSTADWLSCTAVYALVPGDYLECFVYQASGGNLNVVASAATSPEFAAVWLAPIP